MLAGDVGRNPDADFPNSAQAGSQFHYEADGKSIALAIHNDRVAIRRSANAGHSLLLDGLMALRNVEDGVTVYSGVNSGSAAERSRIASATGIESVYPVFINPKTGTELVLIDEVIVSLRTGVTSQQYFGSSSRFASYRPLAGTPNQFVAKLECETDAAALRAANDLARDPRVEWTSPNFYQNWKKFYTPNDPRLGGQWHVENTGQGGGVPDADTDLTGAWDFRQGASPSIVVSVVDDGVEAHPDLNLWTNAGEIAGNSIDDDGNGWIDDINGWNFVNNNNQSHPTHATNNHGTAVAGVAGARGDNALGVAGAAYGSRILSARIFSAAAVASDAGIASALHYAAGRTANGLGTWSAGHVVNNSWGGGSESTAINNAITWATTQANGGMGATMFFSSGNGFASTVGYPARRSAVTPGVVAVGATNNHGERSDYSNYGPELDLVTPSNDTRGGYLSIDTTDRTGANGYDPSDYTGTGFNGFGGTSSASPLAAGIGALVLARAQDLSIPLKADQLRAHLRNNTDLAGGFTYDPLTGKTIEFGYGRLNAASAVGNVGKSEISVLDSMAELGDGSGSLVFGTGYTGLATDLPIRIRNQGTEPLELTSIITGSSHFEVVDFAPFVLELGESLVVNVRFRPGATGALNDTLTILSNDLDEGEFTLGLSGTGQFSAASGDVFEDHNGNANFEFHERGIAGQLVYADLNGNDQWDGTQHFVQSTPLAINDLTATVSPLVVSGVASPIQNVKVLLNIAHTWDEDLDVRLFAPGGTSVLLFQDVGGSGDNFTNTILDDSASTPISSGSAPFSAAFQPMESLSGFDGLNANGTWELHVFDDTFQDVGTLLNWKLTIETGNEPGAISAEDGSYAFSVLPNGTYAIRSESPADWSGTTPVAGEHEITITGPGDHFPNLDFGAGRNNRIYSRVIDDPDRDGIADPGEMPVPGQTVFVDSNGNGSLTQDVWNFANTTDVAFGATNATSVINVPVLAGPLQDVNVRVNLTHSYNQEVSLFLLAPDGKRVQLVSVTGGSSDNFINTVFDDEAASGIRGGTAPFTGNFRPLGKLSDFDSVVPNGNWTLELGDNEPAEDNGLLDEWELILTTGEASATTDPHGNAIFDVAAGNHTLRLIQPAGYYYTLPATGIHSIVASGQPLFATTFGVTQDVLLQGTSGNDVFDVTYTGTGTSSWNVLRNGSGIFTGTVPAGKKLVILGGDGTDTINLNGRSTGDTFSLSGGTTVVNSFLMDRESIEQMNVFGHGGTDQMMIVSGSATSITFTGGAGNDTIIGPANTNYWNLTGANAGTLVSAGGSATFSNVENITGGSQADDLFLGSTGSLLWNFNGGLGVNTLDYSSRATPVSVNLGLLANGNATSIGGIVSNVANVMGGSAADTLIGNNLANILLGNGGDDNLTGGAGSDTLAGAHGNDTYVFAPAVGVETELLTELTGQGNDTISFSTLTTNVKLNLGVTTAQTVHVGRILTLNHAGTFENAIGGSAHDTLSGNSWPNILSGGGGNDTLDGRAGNDSLFGGLGNDTHLFNQPVGSEADTVTETAGQGIDTVSFKNMTTGSTIDLGLGSAQTVHAGRTITLVNPDSFENATGGLGNDTLIGNAQANRLTGGDGNDTLDGRGGSDVLLGGNHDDLYVFGAAASAEADQVIEYAGAGLDELDFSALASPVTLQMAVTGVQQVHANRTLKLNSAVTLESALGGSADDLLIGNSSDNLLFGNEGNNVLVGLGGNDFLMGDTGRDILVGGLGIDTLVGGDNEDILIAGRTTNDSNLNGLGAFRTEWISGNDYATRTANLRAGVGAPVVSLIAKTNVLNDSGAVDSLTGGLGQDWFFRALDDAIADLEAGESIDVL